MLFDYLTWGVYALIAGSICVVVWHVYWYVAVERHRNQRLSVTAQSDKTAERQRLGKSQAKALGAGGAVVGFLISIPSIYFFIQVSNMPGGDGSLETMIVLGIVVCVVIGWLSGYGSGMNQFKANCPACGHTNTIGPNGVICPACSNGLYIDNFGNCQVRGRQSAP